VPSNVTYIYKKLSCSCRIGKGNKDDYCRPTKGGSCYAFEEEIKHLKKLALEGDAIAIDGLNAMKRMFPSEPL